MLTPDRYSSAGDSAGRFEPAGDGPGRIARAGGGPGRRSALRDPIALERALGLVLWVALLAVLLKVAD